MDIEFREKERESHLNEQRTPFFHQKLRRGMITQNDIRFAARCGSPTAVSMQHDQVRPILMPRTFKREFLRLCSEEFQRELLNHLVRLNIFLGDDHFQNTQEYADLLLATDSATESHREVLRHITNFIIPERERMLQLLGNLQRQAVMPFYQGLLKLMRELRFRHFIFGLFHDRCITFGPDGEYNRPDTDLLFFQLGRMATVDLFQFDDTTLNTRADLRAEPNLFVQQPM